MDGSINELSDGVACSCNLFWCWSYRLSDESGKLHFSLEKEGTVAKTDFDSKVRILLICKTDFKNNNNSNSIMYSLLKIKKFS